MLVLTKYCARPLRHWQRIRPVLELGLGALCRVQVAPLEHLRVLLPASPEAKECCMSCAGPLPIHPARFHQMMSKSISRPAQRLPMQVQTKRSAEL